MKPTTLPALLATAAIQSVETGVTRFELVDLRHPDEAAIRENAARLAVLAEVRALEAKLRPQVGARSWEYAVGMLEREWANSPTVTTEIAALGRGGEK